MTNCLLAPKKENIWQWMSNMKKKRIFHERKKDRQNIEPALQQLLFQMIFLSTRKFLDDDDARLD